MDAERRLEQVVELARHLCVDARVRVLDDEVGDGLLVLLPRLRAGEEGVESDVSSRSMSSRARRAAARDCERERRTRFLVRSFAEGADAGILMTFFHRSADEESESGENCLSSCAAFSAISPCEESARARREARKR